LRPVASAAVRSRPVTASRIGPSLPLGLNRCSAIVSMLFCCIHWQWTLSVCWS
jgi:hypothetical protein